MKNIIAKISYQIRQIDVNGTFFYRFLDKKIYILQLANFENNVTKDYFLKKAWYGLKQVSWVYFQTFLEFLIKIYFNKTESDYGLFVRLTKQCLLSSI